MKCRSLGRLAWRHCHRNDTSPRSCFVFQFLSLSVELNRRRTIVLLYLYSSLYLYFLHCFLRFRMHEVQYVARHDCHKSNTRPLWYFAFQFCQSLQCFYLYLYLYLYLQLYLRMYEGPRLSQKWHLTTLVTPLHSWLPHPLPRPLLSFPQLFTIHLVHFIHTLCTIPPSQLLCLLPQ